MRNFLLGFLCGVLPSLISEFRWWLQSRRFDKELKELMRNTTVNDAPPGIPEGFQLPPDLEDE